MGAAERRIRWTRAYIGGRDRIFPPANMERYWSEDPDTEIVRDPEGLHLPDMEGIIRSVIADPGRVSRRFAGASSSYDTHAIAQRTATIRMGIKLERKIAGLTGRILEIGPGTGLFTREYSRFLHPEEATFIDITEVGPFGIAPTEHYHQGDAERWIEDDRTLYDCILSTSAIQWFADIPRFLAHCAERLRPGGTLALSTFLPGNLEELDRLRPTPLRYPTPELLRDALARSFDEIEIEPDEIRVEFRSVREMLMHLKHTGVAGSAPGGGGLKLSEMSELRTLTYRPVYLTARRK